MKFTMSATTPIQVPRYCPECGSATSDQTWDRPFCARCGGTLVDQSFCAICESHWRLPAGDNCPKHDIPLEEATSREALVPAAGPSSMWQTVHKFPHSLAAAGARIRLEAEGIPTFIDGERMGSPSMYRVATGGVNLQVPAHLANDARIILDQTWQSRPAEDPDDDLDDAWEDLSSPADGMVRPVVEMVRVIEALVLFLTLGPIVLWLVARVLGFA
jgi:hypothetical protein